MVTEFSKHYSKKTAVLALLLLLAYVPVFAQSETPTDSKPATVITPTPAATPKAMGEGNFGLGISSITVSPRYAESASADNLTLVDIRYWLSNQFILEAFVGGTAGVQIGENATGNALVNDPFWAYSYGLGVKSNLLQPFDGFYIQAVTRLLYLQNSSQSSGYNGVYIDQYQYMSLSVGFGFEYFMPFLKNLSVETSETVEFDDNWENETVNPTGYEGGSTTPVTNNPSTWLIKVNSPGFNITSLSIHYYF